MSARMAMMSTNHGRSERWNLLRKMTLLILLMLALALGLVILFRQKNNIPLVMFNILADVSMGLIAGIATRIVLRGRNWLIQVLASTAIVIVGLFVLGYFTSYKSGIGPLPFGLNVNKVNWLDPLHIAWGSLLRFRPASTFNFTLLAHLVIGIDTSWIALRAWRRSLRISSPAATNISQDDNGWGRAGSSAHIVSMPSSAPSVSVPQVHVPSSAPRTRSRVKRSKKIRASMIGRPALPPAVRPRSKRWNPLHSRAQVQLAVYEEHRCPYCFEEVKRNDPRGVVECEVCHTLHHKDCWDITGVCQVPHLNT